MKFEAEVRFISSKATLIIEAENWEEARRLARSGFGEKPEGDFEEVRERPKNKSEIENLKRIGV